MSYRIFVRLVRCVCENESMSPLYQLPGEILVKILSEIDPIDYATVVVRWRWLNMIITSDYFLKHWKYGPARTLLITHRNYYMECSGLNRICGFATYGHIDLVKRMINRRSYNACTYNMALSAAIPGGYIDIVRLMLDLGVNNHNVALKIAARHGHGDISDLLIKYGANEINNAIRVAISCGKEDALKQLLRKSPTPDDARYHDMAKCEKPGWGIE